MAVEPDELQALLEYVGGRAVRMRCLGDRDDAEAVGGELVGRASRLSHRVRGPRVGAVVVGTVVVGAAEEVEQDLRRPLADDEPLAGGGAVHGGHPLPLAVEGDLLDALPLPPEPCRVDAALGRGHEERGLHRVADDRPLPVLRAREVRVVAEHEVAEQVVTRARRDVTGGPRSRDR